MPRRPPGQVRDAILQFFAQHPGEATTAEIYASVNESLGGDVPKSSVRSYLNINGARTFVKTSRGRYRLARP